MTANEMFVHRLSLNFFFPPPMECHGILNFLCLKSPSLFSTGLDDICLDAVLGDGIHGQTLQDNKCYQELSSQSDLRKAVENEKFIVSSIAVLISIMKMWITY